MSRRSSRSNLLTLSINLGLVAGIGMFGCGEARPSTDLLSTGEIPNGVVGTLHARIASYDDGHAETFYRLVRDDGEEISLDFGKIDPRARVGERIAVRGPRSEKRIEVDAFDVVRRDRPSSGTSQGRDLNESRQALKAPAKKNFKLAMIGLDMTVTAAKMKSRVFSDADSPAAFYRDNSYGDWTMEGDVFGPYTITIANCQESNLWNIAADAKKAAEVDGIDVTKYDNFMYYMPASAGCSWGGIAEVGVSESKGFINAVNSWYRGTGCVVLAQELGHNFGLLHSHKCTGTPYAAKTYGATSSCPGFSEYGDPFTPMGGGCGHFNAPESAAQGFISGCNTLDLTSSGTFEIGPIEAKCAGPQVLRLSAKATANQGPQYIYLEYRRGMGSVGSDSKSQRGVYFHASAEYGGNPTDIVFDAGHDFDFALDPFYIREPMATVDATWTEPSSGATFTIKAIGDTATIDVAMPGTTPGAAKCIDGATPPSAPMCATIVSPEGGTSDGGTSGDAARDGAGGSGMADAAPDTGSSGTAGTGGTGGATGGSSGTGGAAGSGGSSADDGCSCSIPGGGRSPRSSAALLGLAALLPALRRRGSRRPD